MLVNTGKSKIIKRHKMQRNSAQIIPLPENNNPISHENIPLYRPTTLLSLKKNYPLELDFYNNKKMQRLLAEIFSLQQNSTAQEETKELNICFVSPILPHPCELEIWNECAKILSAKVTVITSKKEENSFQAFCNLCNTNRIPVYIDCKMLEGCSDGETFLSGLEAELTNSQIVIAVGESYLSTYQAMKSRRTHRNRLLVWQNSPRPPEARIGCRSEKGFPLPQVAREKTIRREILKSCDILLSFDKDSSSWAYLEDVHAQRIRRVSRGINLKRFSSDLNSEGRLALRAELGLPETDFIFLQVGPLEIETGALDTVYSFKNLLQSNATLLGHTKLVFCGSGTAGADIRQAVVNLKMDEHVFFLNPKESTTNQLQGNQLACLLAISDAVIHNPISVVNGNPLKNHDCSYDVLCAMASGLGIVSNGNGWVGEWLSKFYHTFAAGNIHNQAKLMRDSIEKQDKVETIKRSVRKALENELGLERSAQELCNIIKGLILGSIGEQTEETLDQAKLFESIDGTVQAKRYLDAIQLIQRAFEIPDLPSSRKAFLFRNVADCFTKLGDLESGQANYLRAADMDPYCARTFIGLGTVALLQNNYNVAVPHFQKSVMLEPNDDMANLGLGLAFEGLGEKVESLNWCLRAGQFNPSNTAAIYNVVKLAYELDRYSEAENLVARYVTLHPHDGNMIYTLGGLVFKLGKYHEAAILMENILMLNPMDSRAHGLLLEIKKAEISSKSRKQA